MDASLRLIAIIIQRIFAIDWPLIEGAVYTVYRLPVVGGELAIELVEVKNIDQMERCFRRSRFRPLVERKTDISVFTEILHKETKPALIPALSLHHRCTQ